MSETWDLVIVGGGAAGLAAGIFAADAAAGSKRIAIIEGTGQCGTKILASGGGRCNVTHETVTPDDFSGSKNIVRNILAAFDAPATVAWFSSLGVELKREETGKLFPVTDSAKSVVNALLDGCRQRNVTVLTNTRVTGIRQASPFQLLHASGVIQAHKIILATGGRSLPKSGSDGIGWDIARQLGHSVTSTHQALAPLMLDASFFHAELSGIARDVELSTFLEGKRIDHRTGALLFTHFGVSGPAVMDVSRFWVMAKDAGQLPELRCNLLPGDDFGSLDQWLIAKCALRPKAAILTLLTELLPERVAACLLKHSGIIPATPAGQVSRESRRTLIHACTALVLPVTQPRGWNYAEVTAGGVPLSEINFRTMESRKAAGLYLIGEILDCDGRIGGFNFQWAWSTAFVAGKAAGKATSL